MKLTKKAFKNFIRSKLDASGWFELRGKVVEIYFGKTLNSLRYVGQLSNLEVPLFDPINGDFYVFYEIFQVKSWNLVDSGEIHLPSVDVIISTSEAFEDSNKKAKAFSRPRDYQRSKTYACERNIWYTINSNYKKEFHVPEEKIQKVVDFICNHYGIKVKAFVTGRSKTSVSRTFCNQIELARGWGQNLLVIIHELSHQLHEQKYKNIGAAHGAEFNGIYFSMMADVLPSFTNISSKEIMEICKSNAEQKRLDYDLSIVNDV
jgi:hypothetical protein